MLKDSQGQPYLWITIDAFDYMLIRQNDSRFRVWHHITPADGGYGREVDLQLPADYFHTHTAAQFYDHVAALQQPMRTPPSRAECLRALTAQLKEAGWLD